MFRMRLFSFCASIACTAIVLAQTPEDFGFDTLRINGKRAEGERPLLTVLLQFSDNKFAPEHTPAFYRRLLFGTEDGEFIGSVAGRGSFFDENSYGRFLFRNAGIVGPVMPQDDPSTPGDESANECAMGMWPGCNGSEYKQRAAAMRAAAAIGFRFWEYDANGDGRITDDELTIAVIGAAARGDNLTLADPSWAGRPGSTMGNYQFVRLEGYVFAARDPQPVGTVPLNRFHNNWRGDFYTTNYARTSPPRPDYTFQQTEGYVSSTRQAGMIPLYEVWSPETSDHATTTDISAYVTPGRISVFPVIGYVYPPSATPRSGLAPLYRWYNPKNGGSATWGATRPTDPGCVRVAGGAPGRTVDVCVGSVVGVGEAVAAATLAHELTHTLGIGEEYGSNCRNQRYTIMSCTVWDTPDLRQIYHLDPYSKIRLGWVRPEIVRVTDSRCIHLQASSYSISSAPHAYIAYDPARGVHEYFILEHRWGTEFTYDGDPWLTGQSGLRTRVWRSGI